MTNKQRKINHTAIDVHKDIATWLAQRQKSAKLTRKEYLAAFLAARADIIEARAAGYALKTIWEHMNEIGRLPFRYETFLKYARQHITNAQIDPMRQE
ncbi:MAG: TraK family protein [Candidatus Thiodiazotropha endolucinida]